MKKIFILSPLFISSFCFSQSYQLKLTNPEKGNSTFIKKDDKVLLAIKVAKHQTNRKPSDVYLLSKIELTDSIHAFSKGRILSINDSSIIMKERNSFFSATKREIRINKINSLRKLSAGNQIFRTVATVGGGLAFGILIFYSYAEVGGCYDCIAGMFKAAGTSLVLTRFGRIKISKKQLNSWQIEVVTVP